MKKVILLTFFAVITFFAFAQRAKKPSPYSGWYEPIEWLHAYSRSYSDTAFITSSVEFLMKDSIPAIIDSNGNTIRNYAMYAGNVMDAKDDVIDLSNTPEQKLSKFHVYDIDSFYLEYIYVRNVHLTDNGSGGKIPVVDTLFVHYYNRLLLNKDSLNNGSAFVRPQWNMSTHGPAKYSNMQTILLTAADTTGVKNVNGGYENAWPLRKMVQAAPYLIRISGGPSLPTHSDNFVGVTFTFKPGMAYDSGSVMIYQKDPATFQGKRVNYFGYRVAQNTDTNNQWTSNRYYNHSLFSYKENAYYSSGPINQNWGGFVPGNAYPEGRTLFHGLYCSWYFYGGGTSDTQNETFSLGNIYPNPASVEDKMRMAFTLKNKGNVNIAIYSSVGQLVKQVVHDFFSAGAHELEPDLGRMEAGLYFLNMSVNGINEMKKIVITQ